MPTAWRVPSTPFWNRVQRWSVLWVALPLALFVLVAVLLPQPKPQVVRIESAQLWLEPLGKQVFDPVQLAKSVRTRPQMSHAAWTPISLPHSQPLDVDIDLPQDAPKARAWFRVQVPAQMLTSQWQETHGQIGLMGNRIMGGPWALWVNGRMVQTNLNDWRIGWNVPVRAKIGRAHV